MRPMAILIAAVAASAAFLIAHVAIAPYPSETVQALASIGLALAFVLWITMDARDRRQTPCYDFGFLVAVFFPASLVWYVLWTRGWRGVLTLVALTGLMLFPGIAVSVVWTVTHAGH